MKPAPLTYYRARDLAGAVEQMASSEGFAKYIAGGQTLGPMINLRLTQPDSLIDISGIVELREVVEEIGGIRIGGGIRHSEIEDLKVPDVSGGLLPRAAKTLAYRAVRNRGTIGGSLAHADPVAEWPTLLMALQATVHIFGRSGKRSLPIDQFLLGYLTTALDEDEIVTAVSIPRIEAGARVGFKKFCRKSGEFAHSIVGVVISKNSGQSCVSLGSAAGTPIRLPTVASTVASVDKWRNGLDAEIHRAVAIDIADRGVTLDEYETHLHTTIVARAVKEALQ